MDSDYQLDTSNTPESNADLLDYIQRNQDEYNLIITPDNVFPDILEGPLFVSTVPESPPGDLDKLLYNVDNPSKPAVTVNVDKCQANSSEYIPINTINDRTKKLTDSTNDHEINIHENKLQKRRSIKYFISNFSKSILGLTNDLLAPKPSSESWYSHLITIVTKDDRLVAIGVLMVLFSIVCAFMRNSD